MWHVPKNLSKKERQEWREWQEKHRQALPPPPTRLEQAKNASKFFASQARAVSTVVGPRSTSHIPSGPSIAPAPEVKIPVVMSDEELRDRETAAQRLIDEKKHRTAPAYNKGGAIYWTEEMAKDFAGGGHRRR